MYKPAVKGPHRPIRRPGGKIWIGSAHYGLGSEISDDTGAIWRLFELADGTRTRADIAARLSAEYDVDRQNVDNLLDTVAGQGWVEEAGATSEVLSERELERYSRSRDYFAWVDLNRRAHPYVLQERLKSASVTVLGLGGTGSAVTMGMAAVGVGKIRCVDFDKVELSNLNRQFLYTERDVGKRKVDAALARLADINSDVAVSGVERRIGSVEDVIDLVAGTDMFFLCADKPQTIIEWANEAAIALGVPWVSGAYNGPMLSVGTYIPGKTGCYECLRVSELERTESLGIADVVAQRVEPTFNAVVAPTAQIAGCFGVLEAINLLTGLPVQSAGRQYHQNFVRFQHSYFIEAPLRPDCAVCGTGAR